MRGLTMGVLVGFIAITLVMVWRWGSERAAETGQHFFPHQKEPREVFEPLVQVEAGSSPRDDLAGEGAARRDSPNTSDGNQQPVAREGLRALRLALGLGFERDEALTLARSQEPRMLQAFFAEHTHIDAEWLHRSGLDAEILPELYARWAAGAEEQEYASAPGDVLLSRFSPGADGGPYRVQRSFQAQDRTVFLHYSLPEHYQPDAVLVRWVRESGDAQPPADALQHFDRHALTSDTHLRQEAWMRPAEGWDPGGYRVEIFAADADLQLLATQSYRVE